MTADEIHAFFAQRITGGPPRPPAEIAADYTEDGTVETLSTGTHRGRRQIEEYYQRWVAAFPTLSYTVEQIVAETDRAAVFFTVSGTQEGAFLGLPATRKMIEFRGVRLIRFEGHHIAHERFLYDFGGLLIKMGVLKVKPGS